MEKIIEIGGKELKMKTNAGLLRRYREWVGRDLVSDVEQIMNALNTSLVKDENGFSFSQLPVDILTKFEDISYAMNRYGDPEVPADIYEWLDQFETFDIYTVFPTILDLWNSDNQTTSEVKKNNETQ